MSSRPNGGRGLELAAATMARGPAAFLPQRQALALKDFEFITYFGVRAHTRFEVAIELALPPQ